MKQKLFLLSAGGTGGHLFPAQALAIELVSRGHCVHLTIDQRTLHYVKNFPGDSIHLISSSAIRLRNPIKTIKACWTLFKGFRQSLSMIRKIKPDGVVGFGGYPTIPPLLAAFCAGCPTLLHEQNAVMGRANRILAKRVDAIAGGFLPVNTGAYIDKTFITGNPVRPAVIEMARQAYRPSVPDHPFNLVVFGGSQGTRFFAQILPEALSLMSFQARNRVVLTLQVRQEDVCGVKAKCAELNIQSDISVFFDNLIERIGSAHLVISRSGASSVSELSAIGRPAILVPYPYALDHDQAANAQNIFKSGGVEVIPQSSIDAKKLAQLIEGHINNPQNLVKMAANAKLAGKLNATDLMADLVEAIAIGQSIQEFKDQHK